MTIPARKTHPHFRALIQYSRLPAGHMTFQASDDGSSPHLNETEFAVVDTTDRSVQHGELYVIQHETGRRRRRIVQVRQSMANIVNDAGDAEHRQVWWTGDLAGFRQLGDGDSEGVPSFRGLTDGPYLADSLQARLVGRVVGFAQTALGDPMPSELGFENEAEANAAFDAGEYIDTLLRAGHRPYLMRRGDQIVYFEGMPDQVTPAEQEEAVIAVRWKYVRASTALPRLKAECERRGMFA